MIQTIPLGSTDIQISPLGIGTLAWGDSFMFQLGRGEADDADLALAYQASLAYGVAFFDTAEIYSRGHAERLLGRFARQAGWPVVIASKFFPYPWRLGKDSVLAALRASLGRLGLSRLDLYQLHWPFPPVSTETWMEGLADAVDAGLVRAVGVSNYDEEQMRRAHAALARRGVPLASNQVEYSLLARKAEESGLLRACRELNVTLIAYSPLARGLLTGKYTPQNPPQGLRRWRYRPSLLASIQPLVGLLGEIGQGHGGKTPGQVALNWVISKGGVPIPGAKNAGQAAGNAGAMGWHLDAAEVEALDQASSRVRAR